MNPNLISKTNSQNSKPSPVRRFTIAAGACLLLVAGATSSCNTTRGLGQDIEKTGDKIQEAATH